MFKICYFIAKGCFLLPFVPWISLFRFNRLEYTVALVYALNSLVTLLLYAADKQNAEQNKWRIPEVCLHCWELLFGWPGALLGQKIFRHKSRKLSYRIVFWLCVITNIVSAIVILLLPGRLELY